MCACVCHRKENIHFHYNEKNRLDAGLSFVIIALEEKNDIGLLQTIHWYIIQLFNGQAVNDLLLFLFLMIPAFKKNYPRI